MSHVPPSHPRATSLHIRESLVEGWKRGIVSDYGMIAHGRGEAFDYFIGESTSAPAARAIETAASCLLLASYPAISVNGNSAALVARELVTLASEVNAKLEVNLFYRTRKRMEKVAETLKENGATEILGLGLNRQKMPGFDSPRSMVDPEGILPADVILVPLEDGDRTEALRRFGKTVIAVDLNPISRTSLAASITIVDNIVRALPLLLSEVKRLKKQKPGVLRSILASYDNKKILASSIQLMLRRLTRLSRASFGE